jgi:hypothetical protein
MLESALPSMIGVVLLLLVALLALVAEGRSLEGRWFALVNLFLAITAALGGYATSAPYDRPERTLLCGRLAYGTASIAFVTLYLQLAALARDTVHPSLVPLRRLKVAVVALTLVMGAWCAETDAVVSGVEWRTGAGYVPTFGAGVWLLLLGLLLTGA